MRQLSLPLKDSPYTICIGSSLLAEQALLTSYCEGEKVLIVSNEIVAPLYYDKLVASLTNKKIHSVIIKDGEVNKSRTSFFQIIDYLVENNFRRNDTLIALGGGVIGDLSGFAAASFQRGMNLLQVPTSLLAQVDSSVGGKTAINHVMGKNLIGAFYQPVAVIIDTDSLKTLPDREYFSGLGEIVKYALLGENKIQELLSNNIQDILVRDEAILQQLIYLSCQKKANIVAKDEKEKGERALLNLGHTFAHALETLTQYRHYLHGEAVSIGILMALSLSYRKHLIGQQIIDDYTRLFEQLNLPTKIDVEIDIEEFLLAMTKDKKNLSDSYRVILVSQQGCIIQEETDKALLASVIKEYIS
jgi:3-dehydroquinate synthase